MITGCKRMHAFHVGADFRSRSTWQRRTRKTAAIVEIAKMAMNKKKLLCKRRDVSDSERPSATGNFNDETFRLG